VRRWKPVFRCRGGGRTTFGRDELIIFRGKAGGFKEEGSSKKTRGEEKKTWSFTKIPENSVREKRGSRGGGGTDCGPKRAEHKEEGKQKRSKRAQGPTGRRTARGMQTARRTEAPEGRGEGFTKPRIRGEGT